MSPCRPETAQGQRRPGLARDCPLMLCCACRVLSISRRRSTNVRAQAPTFPIPIRGTSPNQVDPLQNTKQTQPPQHCDRRSECCGAFSKQCAGGTGEDNGGLLPGRRAGAHLQRAAVLPQPPDHPLQVHRCAPCPTPYRWLASNSGGLVGLLMIRVVFGDWLPHMLHVTWPCVAGGHLENWPWGAQKPLLQHKLQIASTRSLMRPSFQHLF